MTARHIRNSSGSAVSLPPAWKSQPISSGTGLPLAPREAKLVRKAHLGGRRRPHTSPGLRDSRPGGRVHDLPGDARLAPQRRASAGATTGTAISRILAEQSRGDAIADLEAVIAASPLATWALDGRGRDW